MSNYLRMNKWSVKSILLCTGAVVFYATVMAGFLIGVAYVIVRAHA